MYSFSHPCKVRKPGKALTRFQKVEELYISNEPSSFLKAGTICGWLHCSSVWTSKILLCLLLYMSTSLQVSRPKSSAWVNHFVRKVAEKEEYHGKTLRWNLVIWIDVCVLRAVWLKKSCDHGDTEIMCSRIVARTGPKQADELYSWLYPVKMHHQWLRQIWTEVSVLWSVH